MAQITTGIRSVLSIPSIYRLLQKIMGAEGTRKALVKNYLKPQVGMRILDIGCGPADILNYLPDVEYYGFDISASYIAKAKQRFGDRGTFCAKNLGTKDLEELPKFDLVLMLGVLHHMDDTVASHMFEMIKKSLKPKGRLITLDGVFEDGQSPLARFLISKDRGQNVRTGREYSELAQIVFSKVDRSIIHKAFIPYTLCILECSKDTSF